MQTTLSPELYWTTLTALFTSFLWVPHILQRIFEMMPYDALRDPLHDVDTQAPWARRAIRAHTNAIENLLVFGLLAIIIQITAVGTTVTAMAAAVFFYTRIAHYGIYIFGIPWLRTPVFLIGFACQITLGMRILGLI